MADLQTLGLWLDGYAKAWRSNDEETIAALFTQDAVYRWHPWDEGDASAQGRDAIISSWMEEPDEPDAWELSCEPLAVNGDLGVARCVTRYLTTADEPETTYHNIFVVRLTDDGRASEFTEYFMKEPAPE